MFYAYWIIALFMTVLIVWNLYKENDLVMRLVYGVMAVPFLLRVFLLK